MLTSAEHERIRRAIEAANLIPFIDDIEDFVWEAVWAYSQELPPPSRKRSKDLFDVVDPRYRVGWSAKTLVWSLDKATCEFVIQRADVIKKREILGFSGLSLDSDPNEIGEAVMAHWRMKILSDARKQGVTDSRVALLIKSKDRMNLVPYEEPLIVPTPGQVTWAWSSDSRAGLLGTEDGSLRYRWYSNQKQLFEIFPLDPTRIPINVNFQALSMGDLFNRLGLPEGPPAPPP